MLDKLIVTNMSALKAKYGHRLTAIQGAIRALIARDKKRGLHTRLVALDRRSTTWAALKLRAVPSATDQKANKQAIDGVYRKLTPDYLLILLVPSTSSLIRP